MPKGLQIGRLLLAIVACAGLVRTAAPQKPPAHNGGAPPHATGSHPQNAPQPSPKNNPNRPPANPNRPPANQNYGGNRPPASSLAPPANLSNGNRPNGGPGARMTPRQQLGATAARPWVDNMRDLTPQQREQVLQNSRAFQNLSPEKQSKIRQQFNQWDRMNPAQRADLREKETTWRNLTPEQRDHIKNDVLPQWRQMPWDRQQMMKQKLGVLQNMPESARNQRLNDPNFTKGMSDDEKSMLHDLSHMHVGAPPDSPTE